MDKKTIKEIIASDKHDLQQALDRFSEIAGDVATQHVIINWLNVKLGGAWRITKK